MRLGNKKFLYISFILIVFISVGIYRVYAAAGIEEGKAYEVVRVIDGDTFVVRSGWKEIKVRLLGIDTPETQDPRKPVQCFGKEAYDELLRLIDGRTVSFELSPNREKRDKYGRYLVYGIGHDGFSLNEHLLRNGFAREYTYGKPYSRQRAFRAIERVAKTSEVGQWGACKQI